MITALLFIAVCFLAYANGGANDNFKGVASLFGSGAASYRQSLTWSTVTTLAGSLGALYLAQTLLVIFASKFGMPVSTTHVTVGALFGIGLTTGNANGRMIVSILLSWLLTLPCAALCAAGIYGLNAVV